MNQPNYPYGYPYMLPNGQIVYPGATPQPAYRQANSRAHLVTGLVAGAAIAYLLSNQKVQQGISATASKAWGTVRGEVEEMKERLADLQAELDYYRSRDQENA